MKLQEFNGGLSTRLRPHLIGINESVEFDNIDSATGALVPAKDKLNTGEACSRYNFWSTSLQRWFTSATYKYWVEFNSSVYDASGVVTTATGTHSIGIAAPSVVTPTVVIGSTKVVGITLTPTEVGSSTALSNSLIVYLCINDTAGVLSDPLFLELPVQETATVRSYYDGNRYGALSYPAKGDIKRTVTFKDVRTETIGSNGVKIYRQYKGAWRLVGTLATSSSSITDTTEDISGNAELDPAAFNPLRGVYQYVMTYYDNNLGRESGPSPVSAEVDLSSTGSVQLNSLSVSSDPSVTHKRIYRVGGDVSLFTLVAQVTNATTSYLDTVKDVDLLSDTLTTEIDLPAPAGLQYLASANTMLFGAVGSKLVFTPIGKPESWPSLYFVEFDDTITSLAVVYSGVLVCTVDKTYIVTGSGPTSLSKSILSLDQGCISHKSMQVLKGTAIWGSADGLCASSGEAVNVISRVKLGALSIVPDDSALVSEVYYVLYGAVCLAFDTALGSIFKTYSLGIDSIAKKGTSLYGHSAGTRYKLFSASNNLAMTYKSPKFIEGRYTEQKLYKKIYIYSKGDIIVEVYINDTLVATKTLATEDNHVILVPQELQRGNAIQLKVTGTGEVLELEYEAGRNTPDGRK